MLSYPSADRVAAQKFISGIKGGPMPQQSPEEDRQHQCKCHFQTKNPERVKLPHRKCNIRTRSSTLKQHDTDDIDDQTGASPSPLASPLKPKGRFKTTSHVLVKHKPVRYFKCPIFGMHKSTVMKLNAHFKRRHPPRPCDKCEAVFHTPSSLSHLKYTHESPRHNCDDCDKKFYFAGELKQH